MPGLQRASVNSFGYGGVNAHAILGCAPGQMAYVSCGHRTTEDGACANSEQTLTMGGSEILSQDAASELHDSAPDLCHSSHCEHGHAYAQAPPMGKIRDSLESGAYVGQSLNGITKRLLVITAKSQEQVLETARKLHSWASGQSGARIDLDSLAYTLSTRRSMHQSRYTFQASSKEEFLLNLSERLVSKKSSRALRTLFIFTGQGSQWHAMGRELIFKYSVFRDSLLQSDKILQDLGASWALMRELGRGEQDSRIHQSEIAQPSSTALQIALVDLLASFGVRPATVIGHSSGEIAAAYAADVLSHRTALRVSFSRSLLSTFCRQKIPSKGAMLAVGLGESQISPLLSQTRNGIVSLACVNSSTSTTVSGDEPAIVDLQGRLDDLGVFNRKLKVDTAYHSHHMHKVAHDYIHALGDVDTNTIDDQVTFISSVTGRQKDKDFGLDYWVKNLVSKVRFSNALEEYCSLESASSHSKNAQHLSVELGPHGALAGPFQQTMTEAVGSLA